MKKERIPVRFLYTLITGAVGKEFVIKHYKYGTVKTKYPDMTKIIASKAQRSCRDKFRDAVAYAKSVMADPVQKEAWRKKVRIKSKLFVMIVRHYLLELKEAAINRRNATKRLILSCFKENGSTSERSILPPAMPHTNNGKKDFDEEYLLVMRPTKAGISITGKQKPSSPALYPHHSNAYTTCSPGDI